MILGVTIFKKGAVVRETGGKKNGNFLSLINRVRQKTSQLSQWFLIAQTFLYNFTLAQVHANARKIGQIFDPLKSNFILFSFG